VYNLQFCCVHMLVYVTCQLCYTAAVCSRQPVRYISLVNYLGDQYDGWTLKCMWPVGEADGTVCVCVYIYRPTAQILSHI
jgi:hypothetical protein